VFERTWNPQELPFDLWLHVEVGQRAVVPLPSDRVDDASAVILVPVRPSVRGATVARAGEVGSDVR
jgi:hypothetical protein